MAADLSAVGLASDANDTLSTPSNQPGYDFTTGALVTDPNSLQNIGTSEVDAVTLQPLSVPSDNTTWGGLDELGSSVSNVASNIFKASGNLIAAQVNRTALLTATGRRGNSLTGAPVVNPNAWHGWVLAAVVAIGVGALAFTVLKR